MSRTTRRDPRFRAFLSSVAAPRIAQRELEPFISADAHAGMVEYLEDVLDQARAGRVQGALLVLQQRGCRSGELGILGRLSDDLGSALMNAARLQHLVQLALDERRTQRGDGL